MPPEPPAAAQNDPSRASSAAVIGPQSHVPPEGSPFRSPPLPASAQQAEADRKTLLRERETREQRSMLRGLIVLAVLAVLISLITGLSRAFPPGWWWRW